MLRTLPLLLVLLGASPAAAAGSGDDIGVSGEYLLGPGDVLRIDVFEVEDLSGDVTLGPDGTIGLPLIGRIEAAGQTVLDVQAELTRRYGDGLLRDPQISVTVDEFRSQPVSVVGAVKEPGVYQLRGRRRLIDVLALAGGFTEMAGETITISRGGDSADELEISVRRLLRPGASDEDNPFVQPRDVVRVSTAGIVYVLGAVQKPGGYPIRDQEAMTVLSAVSLAEGSEGTASLQRARIIRGRGASRQEIPIKLRDILHGRAQDSTLEPNDILYLPDSRTKNAFNRGAEAIVQMATGLVIWSKR